jgi:hypothetical protein
MQPYGVSLAGDIAGIALVAVVFAVAFKLGSPRFAWGWLVACGALSALGSARIVALAVLKGDLPVGLYHLAWLVVSLYLARWAWSRFAATPSRGGSDVSR